MAKLVEEQILVTLSRLVKEGGEVHTLASQEMVASLESIAQELIGDSAVVEAQVIGN